MGTILLKDHQKDKRTKLINLKVTDKELALIQKKANRITGGNVSMWLRYAGMELEPPKRDLVKCRNK